MTNCTVTRLDVRFCAHCNVSKFAPGTTRTAASAQTATTRHDLSKRIKGAEAYLVACPACNTPDQFPQGFFRRMPCAVCETVFCCDLNGIREPHKVTTIDAAALRARKAQEPHKKVKGLFVTAEMASELGLDLSEPKPDQPVSLTCSFCDAPTERIQATFGTSIRLRKKRTLKVIGTDPLETEEVTTHYPRQVVACPACVLQVTSFTGSDGDPDGFTINWKS